MGWLKRTFMKTNDCEATLRKGNLPKSEAVRTLPLTGNGECLEEVKEQIGDGGNMPFSQVERDEKHRPDCSPEMDND
jgi:hypothetical protein